MSGKIYLWSQKGVQIKGRNLLFNLIYSSDGSRFLNHHYITIFIQKRKKHSRKFQKLSFLKGGRKR